MEEQQAIVFCEEAFQQSIPAEVLDDIRTRYEVEIVTNVGSFLI
jgi:hypothetical protein